MEMMETSFLDSPLNVVALIIWAFIALKILIRCKDSFTMVPQGQAFIVERWGRYEATLKAGLHFLMPFADQVAFKQDLREETLKVPPQECFTSDNVKVLVDGVMYISVTDPQAASYGVTDYKFAAVQLAQTTTRSVIGTIELDRTFEERDLISSRVVADVNEAGKNWGIRVHRYEIKSISTPNTVRAAMEQQVTAEREGRALVSRSEGDKMSRINRSEGQKLELINKSEGEMQARINEAEGQAEEILSIANATAESIEKLADAITAPGGEESQRMQLLERYFKSLSNVAKSSTQVVLPANLTDFNSLSGQLGINDSLLTDAERAEAAVYREQRLKKEAAERAAAEAEAKAKAEADALRSAFKPKAEAAQVPELSPVDASAAVSSSPSDGGGAAPVLGAPPSAPVRRAPPPPMRAKAPV